MNDSSLPVFRATVAQDGSGDFRTVQSAADSIAALPAGPAVLHVRPGVYREKIEITRPGVTLEGEDAETTVISWNDGANQPWPGGGKRGTFRSYTAYLSGDGFTARNLTFENTAGNGETAGQAVAASVTADRAAFTGCRFLGRQDTLFTGPLPPEELLPGGFEGPDRNKPRRPSRQYYRNCLIRGDVDFIFGSAAAVFRRCQIESLPRENGKYGYLTAASTPPGQPFGYVFLDCVLTGDAEPDTCFLGRPWRDDAKTVFLRCRMGAHIRPEGFWDWNKPHARQTVFYAESGCTGPGAHRAGRVPWAKELTPEQASGYTVEAVLSGSNGWNPEPCANEASSHSVERKSE